MTDPLLVRSFVSPMLRKCSFRGHVEQHHINAAKQWLCLVTALSTTQQYQPPSQHAQRASKRTSTVK
eukprot:2784-Heterococcus_DN1.PRE.4